MGQNLSAAPAKRPTDRETFVVETMAIEHIVEVRELERRCFPTPWPKESFYYELERNRMARYIVLRRVAEDEAAPAEAVEPPGLLQRIFGGRNRVHSNSVVGFAGLWMMVDEAHITTLAVSPDHQGKGLGELLLVAITEISVAHGAKMMTLEVRPSNTIAQKLYEKHGFSGHGIRPHYYSDDGEDAVVMWSEELGTAKSQQRFEELQDRLRRRVTWESKL